MSDNEDNDNENMDDEDGEGDGASDSDDTQRSNDEHQNPEPFDATLPPAHRYLQLNDIAPSAREFKHEDPGTVLTVSILEMPIVLLPAQLLPFHTDYPMVVEQFRKATTNNDYIALKPKVDSRTTDIATLIQVKSMRERDGGITVQAIGRQRCKILKRQTAINGMPYGEVEVLDERLLPSISETFAPASFSRYRYVKKHYLDELKNWMIGWHVYSTVKAVFDQGPTAFSYWVAANLPIDLETRLRLFEELCTDRRLVDEYYISKQIDLIVCRRCGMMFCKMGQLITVSVEGNSAHYVNPGGYVHDLFTVSTVMGTRSRGRASSEFSWFPGYKWTILECARCGQHVGWRFNSSSLLPASFYALTRGAIRPTDSRNPNVAENVQRVDQLAIV